MDWTSQLAQALDSLSSHKLRTTLTLLGMICGVAAVIAMLSIGEGAKREALDLIETLGLRNIIVQTKEFPDDKMKEIREKSRGLVAMLEGDGTKILPMIIETLSAGGIRVSVVNLKKPSMDDVFVHYTSIVTEGYRTLNEGDKVEFEVSEGPKGLQATNVRKS